MGLYAGYPLKLGFKHMFPVDTVWARGFGQTHGEFHHDSVPLPQPVMLPRNGRMPILLEANVPLVPTFPSFAFEKTKEIQTVDRV